MIVLRSLSINPPRPTHQGRAPLATSRPEDYGKMSFDEWKICAWEPGDSADVLFTPPPPQNATQPEAVYDDFKKNNTTGGRDTLQKAAFFWPSRGTPEVKMRKLILLLMMVVFVTTIITVESARPDKGRACRRAGGKCFRSNRAARICKEYADDANDCGESKECCLVKALQRTARCTGECDVGTCTPKQRCPEEMRRGGCGKKCVCCTKALSPPSLFSFSGPCFLSSPSSLISSSSSSLNPCTSLPLLIASALASLSSPSPVLVFFLSSSSSLNPCTSLPLLIASALASFSLLLLLRSLFLSSSSSLNPCTSLPLLRLLSSPSLSSFSGPCFSFFLLLLLVFASSPYRGSFASFSLSFFSVFFFFKSLYFASSPSFAVVSVSPPTSPSFFLGVLLFLLLLLSSNSFLSLLFYLLLLFSSSPPILPSFTSFPLLHTLPSFSPFPSSTFRFG
ncbi:hypothetical protein C7M84_014635 [Penaeus vannamei]|uniref:Uncharacterized protein n=1 Tax=Penaeus vannamei TaxID=6689 RepID=A0A423SSV7_PENVA|nr:hypothetical protein C7M84_014635 [Penaeus vannamei]